MMSLTTHASPSPAAGLSSQREAHRAHEHRVSLGTVGRGINACDRISGTLKAQSLSGTRDLALLTGHAQSHGLRNAQVSHPVAFPSFSERSLSASAWQRWPADLDRPRTTTLRPPEVVESGDIRLRAALRPAGLKTEVCDVQKPVGFSAAPYHLLAEQATPILPYERTAFMSLAHRDPSA